jgi:hypothetical protein
MAYNYKGVEKVHLRDSSFLDEKEVYDTFMRSDVEDAKRPLLPLRKPAF